MGKISRSSTENSRSKACYFLIIRIHRYPKKQTYFLYTLGGMHCNLQTIAVYTNYFMVQWTIISKQAYTSHVVECSPLTLFHTGSGMTLSHRGGALWPSLIFCYISQQKMALTPKTCSHVKFLIFRHPFKPLFQHSKDSIPPFMSINVDQYLHIETLKIGKTPKGPPFENEKRFCLRFLSNFMCEILRP